VAAKFPLCLDFGIEIHFFGEKPIAAAVETYCLEYSGYLF